jgi:glycosyltransferase involved in cell wall biosynthesis
MEITLLIPVYNEREMLTILWERIQQIINTCEDVRFTWLFVNDGSTDDSLVQLKTLARQNPNVKILSLSRNFGKEAALTAGLAHISSTANGVIIMDADLQDPPSLIPQFIQKFKEGYDMVYGVRSSRRSDSCLKRATAHLFYRGYNFLSDRPMPSHAGDCRLLSRRVIDALLLLPERERFMKGLFNWVGFKSVAVPFERQKREAGTTKWNYWKLWNFALQGITADSTVLLRLWAYIGMCISLLAVLFAGWVAFKKIVWGNPVSGYASLMVAILFCSGVQLISLGMIGEYLSRIFIEVKQRPLYLVDEKINF